MICCDGRIFDPLFDILYCVPADLREGTSAFNIFCRSVFAEIIERKQYWQIPLTAAEAVYSDCDSFEDDSAVSLLQNDPEWGFYEKYCRKLRRQQQVYIEDLRRKPSDLLTVDEKDFLQKLASMQIDFLLSGAYLENIRNWRSLSGLESSRQCGTTETVVCDFIEFRYTVKCQRENLTDCEAAAGCFFLEDQACEAASGAGLPVYAAELFVNGKCCSGCQLNLADLHRMLYCSGRFSLFMPQIYVDGDRSLLDFYIHSSIENNMLIWQLERPFLLVGSCSESDLKLRYCFDYRSFCVDLLKLVEAVSAADNLFRFAFDYSVQTEKFSSVHRLDDWDDVIFDKFCEYHYYAKNLRLALNAILRQGKIDPRNCLPFEIWSGTLPNGVETHFCETFTDKPANPLPAQLRDFSAIPDEIIYYPAEGDEPCEKSIPQEFSNTLELLVDAIDNNQLVEIEYIDRSDETTVRKFAPEIVVIYNDNWYVAGFCKLRAERRTLRVDGIVKIRATDQKEPPHGIAGEVEEYGLFNC